jgi:uncharacterized protein (TIGR00369 family)
VTPYATLMDRYQAAVETGRAAFPYAELLGMRLAAVAPGYAEIELEIVPGHGNSMGTLHGGVYASLADTALGVAHGSLLGEGELSTSVDLQVKFLRPVMSGRLKAAGRVVRHGKTLTYAECEITNGEGQVVARANATCMTLRPDSPSHEDR